MGFLRKRLREGVITCYSAVGVAVRLERLLGFQVKGWDVIGGGEVYQLRDETARYNFLFMAKNSELDAKNALLWDVNRKYSTG